MGGDAFSRAIAENHPPIYTPRMTPDEYSHLKQIYISRLSECFPHSDISSLLEAPGKTSYGDIDLRICCPDTVDVKKIDLVSLATRIGASAIIPLSSRDRHNCTIAVPVDGSRSPYPAIIYHPANNSSSASDQTPISQPTNRHAQIDIDVFPDSPLTAWRAFIQSYGDTLSILNRLIRPYGLIATDRHFALRLRPFNPALPSTITAAPSPPPPSAPVIPEADAVLPLSHTPADVMRFAGLDERAYAAGFETQEAYFAWWAGSRFTWREVLSVKAGEGRNERVRAAKREAYVKFFEEWLPARFGGEVSGTRDAETGREEGKWWEKKREGMRCEAVEFFGKREEYDMTCDAIKMKTRRLTAALMIKEKISQTGNLDRTDKQRLEIMRALRRWVEVEDDALKLLDAPHDDQQSRLGELLTDDGMSLLQPEDVVAWIDGHWKDLLRLVRRPPTGNRR